MIIPEILTPIIILSHTCPESASNHLEIIDSTTARSPQMGTIGDPGRTRRLQDFGRLKSSILIAVAEILMPIITSSHICLESASNHMEIIDSTSAGSPQMGTIGDPG
jgi:hypothetical protein